MSRSHDDLQRVAEVLRSASDLDLSPFEATFLRRLARQDPEEAAVFVQELREAMGIELPPRG